ncbi:MAG: TetR/AcrR family transcriptional regulator [Chloroflexota bacterium]|nr:TetR/AcrR family transcriptional regulator [Ardenticatenaceae bacterium]
MMKRKVDRRILRTRRLLNEALLALLVERDYENITIQDITEQADLNRATFYLHYSSKEELLVAALEEQFDELVASIEDLATGQPIWEDQTPELMTFRHVAEHAPLYKALLSERGTGYIIHRIIGYIAAYGEARLQEELPANIELSFPATLLSMHAAGSLFALVSWWVTNDMPYSPEYMAEVVLRMCNEGTRALIVGSETAVS